MRSILQYWEHKNHTHMTITVKLTIYYIYENARSVRIYYQQPTHHVGSGIR
jgi:hypothetical protein